MMRLTITLKTDVGNALVALAEHDHRNVRQQAALLIRRALESAEYLQPARPAPIPQPQPEGSVDDS